MNRNDFHLYLIALFYIILGLFIFSIPLVITWRNDRLFKQYVDECYSGNKSSCYLASSMCEPSESMQAVRLMDEAVKK